MTQSAPAGGSARQVTLLVPTSSGTGADITSRLLGPKLAERLGRTVVVENRTGASGRIGFAAAAKAAPDGSTILVSPSSMTVLPHLSKELTYDPFNDFAPVALIAGNVLATVVGPSIKANNMAELLALIRANPGKINYATPGIGTPHHLLGELFSQTTGTKIVHVPYKQSAAAVTDMAGGQVHMGFFPLHGVLPLVKAGKLRVLATTAEIRTPWTPEIPTMREAGVPNVTYTGWTGIFVPRATPPDIVNNLSRQFLAIIEEPGMREQLLNNGLLLQPMGPKELGDMIRRDSAMWAQVIKDAGIKPE